MHLSLNTGVWVHTSFLPEVRPCPGAPGAPTSQSCLPASSLHPLVYSGPAELGEGLTAPTNSKFSVLSSDVPHQQPCPSLPKSLDGFQGLAWSVHHNCELQEHLPCVALKTLLEGKGQEKTESNRIL